MQHFLLSLPLILKSNLRSGVKMNNKIRLTFQLIILGLIGYVALRPVFDKSYIADFESYCPFGGLASLGSKLNLGTMSCNMSEVQLFLGIALIVGVIIIGKLFCSFLCPIGSVTEWLSKLGEKLKIRFEIHRYIDRPLRSLKYVILFFALYYTMTSSELFCKEFDPYFAAVNLFDNTDITLYFAIPAFALTILGSIFSRLFWCKYLCPLSAVSNIFLNFVPAAAIIILFIVLNAVGLEISAVWLLVALIGVGLINEVFFKRSFLFPAAAIYRNTDTCIACNKCDEACPQGIHISNYTRVNHIDCNLCTDCVYACDNSEILTVNKKKRYTYWVPAAVVLIIAISLGASSNFELPTLSETWGEYEELDEMDKIAVYEQTGIKNVKCFGSANSIKHKIEGVQGIYGLEAYTRTFTLRIFYNPDEITEGQVKASIFSPIKQKVRIIKPGEVDSLSLWKVGIFELFDLIDFNNLFYALREEEGVYGFETQFGEPVEAIIYFDPNVTEPARIKERIEVRELVAKKPAGEEKLLLKFKCENDGEIIGRINVDSYHKTIFRTYDRFFNDFAKYQPETLSAFVFPFPQSDSNLRRFLGWLSSHLSADDGVVGLATRYTDQPVGIVFFDQSQTDADKIKEALIKDNLTIFTGDGQSTQRENPFKIVPEGEVISAREILEGNHIAIDDSINM